jgi:DNA polymerase-3 subunit epsilon
LANKIKQVVLDTETTGLSPEQGHRIIEIGCIELLDRRPSGRVFHFYLNPQREVEEAAFKVHGLSNAFLADKPLFPEIKQDFLAFIQDAELIIHNASFDIGFLNAELKRIDKQLKIENYASVLDSLELARSKHPGLRNSLDALCKRYQIDASDRTFHGALLDAQLLADVYLAMTSGQKKMDFLEQRNQISPLAEIPKLSSTSPVIYANQQDLEAHQNYIKMMKTQADVVIWDKNGADNDTKS